MRAESLAESLAACERILEVLEHDAVYLNLSPCGEPQLGRRGLYRSGGGHTSLPNYEMALLWVLSFSDGSHSLLDIAERAELEFGVVRRAAADLAEHQLLRLASA